MSTPFVLIIEDNRDIAALFRHVVDMIGYRTEVVLDGHAAAERLSNSQPDVVVLDLGLPGITGDVLLQQIHQDERLEKTKVIVATAYSHMADTLPVEPDLILLKPVSIEQLAKFITRFAAGDDEELEMNPWDKHTGLYNQAFFMKRVDYSLKHLHENMQYLFAILSFKLSRLQGNPANTHSWQSSLKEIVEGVKSAVRPTDTIASIDQDNFYILLENIPDKQIPTIVATRLEKILDRNLMYAGVKQQMPIGVGVALYDRSYETAEEVLAAAKRANAYANV